jgi:hypothetical protein
MEMDMADKSREVTLSSFSFLPILRPLLILESGLWSFISGLEEDSDRKSKHILHFILIFAHFFRAFAHF